MVDPNSRGSSGAKWLWIALIALLAVVLLFWLLNPAGEPDENIVTNEVPVDTPDIPAVQSSEPITNPALLPSIRADIGRPVAFASVPVTRMVGDDAFTIGEGGGETLVMMDETAGAELTIEDIAVITPGETVTVRGRVRSLEGMTLPAGADALTQRQAYIAATEVATN